VERSVFAGSVDVGGLFLPLVEFKEARVGDGIHVNVARGVCGGLEEGVVSFVVDFVRGKEEFGFVDGFVDRKGLGSPVNYWISGS